MPTRASAGSVPLVPQATEVAASPLAPSSLAAHSTNNVAETPRGASTASCGRGARLAIVRASLRGPRNTAMGDRHLLLGPSRARLSGSPRLVKGLRALRVAPTALRAACALDEAVGRAQSWQLRDGPGGPWSIAHRGLDS